MTLKGVTSLAAISGSHQKALLKLVQRASETMRDMWIQDCVTAFGWTEQDAKYIVNELRKRAKRELNAID